MDSHVGSPQEVKAAGRRVSTVEANSAPSLAEVPVTTGKPEGRWLYADKPLRQSDADAVDALALGAYADALALLMDWKATDTPLTIAISGPWGAGKTSLAAMAEARLRFGSDWNSDHVICKFD